jgi:hypothetical protein
MPSNINDCNEIRHSQEKNKYECEYFITDISDHSHKMIMLTQSQYGLCGEDVSHPYLLFSIEQLPQLIKDIQHFMINKKEI